MYHDLEEIKMLHRNLEHQSKVQHKGVQLFLQTMQTFPKLLPKILFLLIDITCSKDR